MQNLFSRYQAALRMIAQKLSSTLRSRGACSGARFSERLELCFQAGQALLCPLQVDLLILQHLRTARLHKRLPTSGHFRLYVFRPPLHPQVGVTAHFSAARGLLLQGLVDICCQAFGQHSVLRAVETRLQVFHGHAAGYAMHSCRGKKLRRMLSGSNIFGTTPHLLLTFRLWACAAAYHHCRP